MSFTTFSGPVRTGTVKEGSAVNTGLAVLSQSATIDFSDTAAKNLFTLPAGSQILGIAVYATEAFNAGTNNVLNIRSGTTVIAAVTATAANITVGLSTVAPVDAEVAFFNNVGATDAVINGIYAPTGTAATTGEATVIVTYVQRAANGDQRPVSA
jgi:uncharacterized protein YjlB